MWGIMEELDKRGQPCRQSHLPHCILLFDIHSSKTECAWPIIPILGWRSKSYLMDWLRFICLWYMTIFKEQNLFYIVYIKYIVLILFLPFNSYIYEKLYFQHDFCRDEIVYQDGLDPLFGSDEADMLHLSNSWKPNSEYLSFRITPETIRDGRTAYKRRSSSTTLSNEPHDVVDLTEEAPTIPKRKAISTMTRSQYESHQCSSVSASSPVAHTTGSKLKFYVLYFPYIFK